MKEKIDPQLLQVRWTLGGIRSEDLPELAVSALQQGLDGTALRQLAGLVRPTMADLENLPERVFAEMGLKPMDKDAAVTLLMARGLPAPSAPMAVLLDSFPDFKARWRAHIAWWGGEPAGSYNDFAEFVHFVVEDLYENENRTEVGRAFRLLEELLTNADEETVNLIGLVSSKRCRILPPGDRMEIGYLKNFSGRGRCSLAGDRKNLGREVQSGRRHPGGTQELTPAEFARLMKGLCAPIRLVATYVAVV